MIITPVLFVFCSFKHIFFVQKADNQSAWSRCFRTAIVAGFLLVALQMHAVDRPNIIVIFTDDLGYEDIGCFNSPNIKTPHIDQMANEGIRLTSFYVGASVCSASRASLMTGRYPSRHGIGGALKPENGGLASEEVTLAEVLQSVGYNTACIGKWHLGDELDFLPGNQGFDYYYGLPYSNDMFIGSNQKFSDSIHFTQGYDIALAEQDQKKMAAIKASTNAYRDYEAAGLKNLVPLFENTKIIEYPADQTTLTKRYFDRGIQYIEDNQDDSFFLFLNPAMPHVPLFPGQEFIGQSLRGTYGDTIEEIDFYIGKLLEFLDQKELLDKTLIVFTSDNGPWLSKGKDGGSAYPLREGKHSIYEGGMRVPAVIMWQGHIEAGAVSDKITASLDLYPTFCHLAAAELPAGVTIDGVNISNLLLSSSRISLERKFIYHTKTGQPYGIRNGDWKYLRKGGKNYNLAPELYNLARDKSESVNLINSHQEVATKLEKELSDFESSL